MNHGLVERQKFFGRRYRYRILYDDLAKEGPMAEVPLVIALFNFLELENPKVKDKAKRCGVSSWTYQRARQYINDDIQYRFNKDREFEKESQKLFNETILKYKARFDETLIKNADILREIVFSYALDKLSI